MTELSQTKQEGVMPREILVGEGISLRLLIPDDAERIFEIFQNDPEIQSRVTWTYGLKNASDIRQVIKNFQEEQSIRYAITNETQVVGYVGMWQDRGYMDGEDHDGWFGFGYFLAKEHRGQGIITKATAGMMSKAEQVFEVKKWAVYVEDDNIASQAALKGLGFTASDHIVDEPIMHTDERRWEKTS